MNAFAFATATVSPAALAAELADPQAGGFASFEGWVRNHNEGQAVTGLEYEAFEALAVKEGERVIEEARARFPILQAACVHRLGALQIGELAVWVGVSARHRDEAFRACRYIIDEIKHRLPIWKKEHYASGDSGWVNCERCALPASHADGHHPGRDHSHGNDHAHGHDHGHGHGHGHDHDAGQQHDPPRVAPDYSRQIALREIGTAGQQKLAASRVLVIGAGGLGVPVLSYLAGAGVGTLIVVDADRLEASNLHRQPLYTLDEVDQPKADLAAARLRALNPQVRIEVCRERFSADNAPQLLAACDLAIDCSDNFATKFLLNDACVLARKPVIFASVYQYEGQLQVYRPEREDSPCLRCLWPQASRDGVTGNCAEAGVLGPVPGVLGSLQALEALKLLLDLPGQLHDQLLILDLLGMNVQRVRARRHPPCRGQACVRITQLPATPEPDLEVSFSSLLTAREQGYDIIDIRDAAESAAAPAQSARCIPMPQLLADPDQLQRTHRYLLLCARGARSRAAAAELRARGYERVYSLRGGAQGLNREG